MTPYTSTENAYAIKLAHLLRAHTVDALKIPGFSKQEAQKAWWLLQGRVELARGRPVEPSEFDWLFEPVAKAEALTGLPMPRALHALRHLKSSMPTSDDADPKRMFQQCVWFYVRGLREHLLQDHLPDSVRQQLNAPAPETLWPWCTEDGLAPPLLMVLVWYALPDIKRSFPLQRMEGRLALFAWFFTAGANRTGLKGLIENRWKVWALDPVVCNTWLDTLPRAAWLKWKTAADVHNDFTLDERDDVKALYNWFEKQIRNDDDWTWLLPDTVSMPLELKASSQQNYPQPEPVFGVNLIGFAKGELGTGEDVRMAAAVCEAHDIPYWIINIPTGANVRQDDTRLDSKLGAQEAQGIQAPYPINIFCLTGFSTATVYLKLGPSLFQHRYNIGWWPWELPVWPARWKPAFNMVDEIWAATRFNELMYAAATNKPVRRVPLSVSIEGCSRKGRAAFGLPTRSFLFLYAFDFSSYLNRKNPMAAVRAFRLAFPDNKTNVRLVLKTMRAKDNDAQWRAFTKACAADSRIILLQDTLDRGDILALMKHCDAYISLHRSEGFGRTLAEAQLMGKPVIASDWSGNRDFVTPTNGFPVDGNTIPVKPGEYPYAEKDDGAVWFDPDVTHAATRMREVWENRKTWKGDAIEDDARMRFAPEHSAMVWALNQLREQLGF